MKPVVAILMKDPDRAKTRLRPALSGDARERLALTMFENTLAFFLRLRDGAGVGVVTPSPRVAEIARAQGAEAILEDGEGGINEAAAQAARWAVAKGAAALLVVHADVPTLVEDEVAALLEAARSNAVVIAESVDGGTNALLLSPPDAIDFRFGPHSAAAHAAGATAAGLRQARLRLPFLSRDLDTPDDLRAHFLAPGRGAGAQLTAFAVPGIPEIGAGDDVAVSILEAMSLGESALRPGDIVVVAQKIVSKSEGRLRRLSDFTPSPRALEIAEAIGKDARKVEAILSESTEILRAVRSGPDGLIITRHRNGWICANAGIDESNLGEGMESMLLLLPEDADRSAQTIRAGLESRCDGPIGVIVTDTFGRPWRQGLVNIAIGVAGVPAIVDWAGRVDAYGRALKATLPAFADEVAAAAGLLMQKDAGTPVVVVRDLRWRDSAEASARDVLRPIAQELFL